MRVWMRVMLVYRVVIDSCVCVSGVFPDCSQCVLYVYVRMYSGCDMGCVGVVVCVS